MVPSAVPVVFAAPWSLRVLNVIAVAASLGACTSALFLGLGPLGFDWGLVPGATTFFVGALWAILLRWQRRAPILNLRWGWIASVPLAALNAGVTAGISEAINMGGDRSAMVDSFMIYSVVGATFGVLAWGPALVVVLVAFGVPIWSAQQSARLGLAGEERGERLVGIASGVLGLLALAVGHVMRRYAFTVDTAPDAAALGRVVFHALALLATACGGAAVAGATARERRRRRFLQRVEVGQEPGFRVDATPAGKVLLRIAPATATYRVADRDEEVFELDQAGRATHRAASKRARG